MPSPQLVQQLASPVTIGPFNAVMTHKMYSFAINGPYQIQATTTLGVMNGEQFSPYPGPEGKTSYVMAGDDMAGLLAASGGKQAGVFRTDDLIALFDSKT